MIIAGIWLFRMTKQIADQQRRELFTNWENQNKMISNALHQIDTQKRQSIETLRQMSDRINLMEDRKENVLKDFIRMLYGKA